MSTFDLKIKEIEKVKKGNKIIKISDDISYKVPINSKLILEFKGEFETNVIINTIRRVILLEVPTYAFTQKSIEITENTSIYDNDYMRNRLSQFPVNDQKLELLMLDEKDYETSNKNISIYINVINETDDIMLVTSNNFKIYEDFEEMKNKYSKECPLLVLKLKPGEKFNCVMKAVLGIGYIDNIFSGASNCYFNDFTTERITGKKIENKENKKHLIIESQGQFDEYDLVLKACKIIVMKFENLKKKLENMIKNKEINEIKEIEKNKDLNVENSLTSELILEGEDHTIGKILSDFLKEDKKILASGVNKINRQQKNISIKIAYYYIDESNKQSYKTSTNFIPVDTVYKQIDKIISLYIQIEKDVKKLIK